MGLYGPITTLWNGGADQLKFPADQSKLHGCVHFTKETCVCSFKISKKWSFGPIRNDARPIVAAGFPRMPSVVYRGVISAPMQRLNHRRRRRDNQTAAQRAALMESGNFNTDLTTLEGHVWDKVIAEALSTSSLEGMSAHLLPQCKLLLRNGWTWSMILGGREIHSRTDHILVTDRCLPHNLVVWDRWHNTDNYLVLGCLCGDAPAAH